MYYSNEVVLLPAMAKIAILYKFWIVG